MIIGDPESKQLALDAWKRIELDKPLKSRVRRFAKYRDDIEFWNIHIALAFIANRYKPKSYLEIGVRTGGSLIQVLANAIPKKVVCVDLWAGSYSGMPNTLAYLKKQVQRAKLTYAPDISYHQGSSHEILPTLTDKFDLITVDGDHTKKGALRDLRDVRKLLNKGGIIVFDDITHKAHKYLLGVVTAFHKENPELKLVINRHDNGTAILLDRNDWK